jgi:sarcosine oxidase
VDVVVVGAGATGCVAAWRLASRGAEVLLRGEAAPGTGDTRAFRVAHVDLTDVSLALQALPLWRELEQHTGPRLLRLTGEIAHGRAPELDLLVWAADMAGKPGRWLAGEEAVERWPGIRHEDRIFFHPLAGRLDGDAAVTAMRTAAAYEGAAVRLASLTAVEPNGENAVAVRTTDGCYHARRAVVTTEAHARTEVCARLPPVREGLPWPVFAHYGETGLIAAGVPVRGGVSACGRDDPARYARRWLPGADPTAAADYRTETGGEFVLDRCGPVVHATGFSGRGFQFLPAVGRMIADLALTIARQES